MVNFSRKRWRRPLINAKFACQPQITTNSSWSVTYNDCLKSMPCGNCSIRKHTGSKLFKDIWIWFFEFHKRWKSEKCGTNWLPFERIWWKFFHSRIMAFILFISLDLFSQLGRNSPFLGKQIDTTLVHDNSIKCFWHEKFLI